MDEDPLIRIIDVVRELFQRSAGDDDEDVALIFQDAADAVADALDVLRERI